MCVCVCVCVCVGVFVCVCIRLRFSRDFIRFLLAFLGDVVYEEILGRETPDLRDFCFVCVFWSFFGSFYPGDC